MIGLGLHRSLAAGLRMPDGTLTGLGEDVDMGDVAEEEAGLIGTVDGAYTDNCAGNKKAMSPLGSRVGTSCTPPRSRVSESTWT